MTILDESEINLVIAVFDKAKYNRSSGLELLRVIAIWGIILMHSFGTFYGTATGGNLIAGLAINVIFNCGVSCFMLISGYFGIRPSVSKTVTLWISMVIYSLVAYGHSLAAGNVDFTLGGLKCALLPVSTGIFWYMTAYFVLMVMALPLQKLTDALSQRQFFIMVITMLVLFSVIPTLFSMRIVGNSGKNIVSMLMVYLIGRYIGRFYRECSFKYWWLLALLGLLAGFALNLAKTYMETGMVGLYAPFAEDDSLVIVFCSVCIFMMFRKMTFKSLIINFIAAGVPGIYMLEQTGRNIGSSLVDFDCISDSKIVVTLLVYATVVFIAGYAVDLVKRLLLDAPIGWLAGKCELVAENIWKKLPFEK